MERYIPTLTGEKIIIQSKEESKEKLPLSDNERKIYNVIRRRWKGITRKELEQMTTLHNIEDIDRACRTIRRKGWIEAVPQPVGPQMWVAKL